MRDGFRSIRQRIAAGILRRQRECLRTQRRKRRRPRSQALSRLRSRQPQVSGELDEIHRRTDFREPEGRGPRDFFRLIHEISGLNVVVDPEREGQLTIVLDNVPWDQALDIVLKNNDLDKAARWQRAAHRH